MNPEENASMLRTASHNQIDWDKTRISN